LASAEDQTLYQPGVGMLLYLVKHLRPDIVNVVRELSKMMNGAMLAAMKKLSESLNLCWTGDMTTILRLNQWRMVSITIGQPRCKGIVTMLEIRTFASA
jgi:hypothetical protein